MHKLLFIIPAFLITILLSVHSVYAQQHMDMSSMTHTEAESLTGQIFSLGLEFINFTLGAIAIIALLAIRRQKKDTNTGTAFIYFLVGIVMLGLIRLFLLLVSTHIIMLDNASSTLIWHIMFYGSAFAFLIGALSLVSVISTGQNHVSFRKYMWSFIIAGALVLAGIVIVYETAPQFLTFLSVDFWEQFGLHHFIAFVFSGMVAFYLNKLNKSNVLKISAISVPLLWAFVFLSAIHMLELTTESYKLILLPTIAIESTEQVLTMIAYVFMIYAFVHKSAEES